MKQNLANPIEMEMACQALIVGRCMPIEGFGGE